MSCPNGLRTRARIPVAEWFGKPNLTLMFFCSHLSGLYFCLDGSYEFSIWHPHASVWCFVRFSSRALSYSSSEAKGPERALENLRVVAPVRLSSSDGGGGGEGTLAFFSFGRGRCGRRGGEVPTAAVRRRKMRDGPGVPAAALRASRATLSKAVLALVVPRPSI